MIALNRNLAGLERSAIRVYTNLANQTPGCVKLTIGEPDFDTPQAIKDAAWEALNRGQTHYIPNNGSPANNMNFLYITNCNKMFTVGSSSKHIRRFQLHLQMLHRIAAIVPLVQHDIPAITPFGTCMERQVCIKRRVGRAAFQQEVGREGIAEACLHPQSHAQSHMLGQPLIR